MTRTVSLDEASAGLAALVDEAESGGDVVIAENGRPRVRLVPASAPAPAARPRVPGSFKGQFRMADDFDAPLPDDLLRLFHEGHADDPLRAAPPRQPRADLVRGGRSAAQRGGPGRDLALGGGGVRQRVRVPPHRHGDPFDRVLIAQAIEEGLTLVTRDPRIRSYLVASPW